MSKLQIRICSLNLHGGLSDKINDDYFKNLVKCYDIICIQEAWLVENNTINLTGYDYYRSDRFKGGHGGIVVFYKHEIKHGLTKIQNKNSDIIWFKLCKKYFDLYIASAYIAPSNSFVHKDTDVFHSLNNDITFYSNLGEVMILGDLNCRISNNTENMCKNL